MTAVQLRWVAPTDLFVELGGEVFNGQNYPSGGGANGGAGVTTLFAHVGGDVGVETSWLAGMSMLRSKTVGGEDGFSGDVRLYVVDVTWKWAPQGNTKDGGITVAQRIFPGRQEWPVHPTRRIRCRLRTGWASDAACTSRASTGSIAPGKPAIATTGCGAATVVRLPAALTPTVTALMLTWRNSEFSLVRLQLSRDYPNPVDADTAVTLQIQTALGAHGAHKF